MPSMVNNPNNQLILASVLGAAGVFTLLPKPRLGSRALGTFLSIASVAVFGHFLSEQFGKPLHHHVGDLLFWFFSAGAVGFAVMMVTQRNPARGAIAFAFVILSSCGLFLLLAAPFLMAATIIIYAGAIIVTFLFVLMLSHVNGPSNENDRTREPLLGSLAGFGFIGLILFTLMQSNSGSLPTPPLTKTNRQQLNEAIAHFTAAEQATAEGYRQELELGTSKLAMVLSDSTDKSDIMSRHKVFLGSRNQPLDPRMKLFLEQANSLQQNNDPLLTTTMTSKEPSAEDLKKLRELKSELMIFLGHGQLPARDVANLGYVIFSEHILAVELAGTLLLVATIGAVAIVGRRREAQL